MVKFNTKCLLSKFGFGDGDLLDDILFDHAFEGSSDEVLSEVVRRYVVPALGQKDVELERVENTIHNPIRAKSVGGVEVDYYDLDNLNPVLSPEHVDVSESDILSIAREVGRIDPEKERKEMEMGPTHNCELVIV